MVAEIDNVSSFTYYYFTIQITSRDKSHIDSVLFNKFEDCIKRIISRSNKFKDSAEIDIEFDEHNQMMYTKDESIRDYICNRLVQTDLVNDETIYIERGWYVDSNSVEYHQSLENEHIDLALGQNVEVYSEGGWHRGIVVEGYEGNGRYVTVKDDDGNLYWVGTIHTDYFRNVES